MLPRVALVILALLIMAVAGLGIWVYRGGPFKTWVDQMRVGTKYMKSLKDGDIPPWIGHSERLLAEYRPDLYPIGVYEGQFGGKAMPPEFKRLKIIRIDIFADRVCYVWMGGMDHTYLEARRLADGSFRLVAPYDDYHSEVIWPKRPNQAMERTAARPALTLSMITPLSLHAALVLASRRSSWSR
jgi:hypothetical protein